MSDPVVNITLPSGTTIVVSDCGGGVSVSSPTTNPTVFPGTGAPPQVWDGTWDLFDINNNRIGGVRGWNSAGQYNELWEYDNVADMGGFVRVSHRTATPSVTERTQRLRALEKDSTKATTAAPRRWALATYRLVQGNPAFIEMSQEAGEVAGAAYTAGEWMEYEVYYGPIANGSIVGRLYRQVDDKGPGNFKHRSIYEHWFLDEHYKQPDAGTNAMWVKPVPATGPHIAPEAFMASHGPAMQWTYAPVSMHFTAHKNVPVI